MLNIVKFINEENERQYLIEHGSDLFGNRFVRVRYGIKLGIAKNYLFDNAEAQQDKVDEIINKRMKSGYRIVS